MSELAVCSEREETILLQAEQAIVNEEFYFMYQPKMHTSTGGLAGFEALIRWDSPILGFVSPAEFIPIFEKCGYIQALGEYTIRKNIELAGKYIKNEMCFQSIAINVSPIELGDKRFVSNIVELCEYHNVPHRKIQLEITEGVNIDSVTGAIEGIDMLQKEGFQLAIDDFGSGYASNLLEMDVPMDILKLDKSFIDELSKNKATVHKTIQLADSLGYKVVAEGVETEEQLNILTKINCPQVQGYYISEPLEEHELIKWCPQFV